MAVKQVARAVAAVGRRLESIYRLDLGIPLEQFVVAPSEAKTMLPEGPAPRSGFVVLEEEEEVFLGLYLDGEDLADRSAVVEETSHLLCFLWHAVQKRSVSPLLLEFQSEVDRYAVARLSGQDAFWHFRSFRFAKWMTVSERSRYHAAHHGALRYCRQLERRFPGRSHRAPLLRELRGFYRAGNQEKLRWVEAS